MNTANGFLTKEAWDAYKERELPIVTSILENEGYVIDLLQPHTEGERYLMQAVTTESGPKLILLGTAATGERVVIKATSSHGGMRELHHERLCRSVLNSIAFAYSTFLSPKEILFAQRDKHLVSIQEFIPQDVPFLTRPTEEQLSFALQAFKAQESTHAATYEHVRVARKTFGVLRPRDYIENFSQFGVGFAERRELHTEALQLLLSSTTTIEQYIDFLTHTDFVPHNFRIHNGNIYLLDHSSIRFGNKHESWARFINFMDLYNRPLAAALTSYIQSNRSIEECESLHLMRVYRLGEIISYYRATIDRSEGALRTLNEARVEFWSEMLAATLQRTVLSDERVESYKALRDSLRDREEKRRQEGLH